MTGEKPPAQAPYSSMPGKRVMRHAYSPMVEAVLAARAHLASKGRGTPETDPVPGIIQDAVEDETLQRRETGGSDAA